MGALRVLALVLLPLATPGSRAIGLAQEIPPQLGSRRLGLSCALLLSSAAPRVAWSLTAEHAGTAPRAGGGVRDEARDVASTLHMLHQLSTKRRTRASIQTHEELRALLTLGGGNEGAREADRLMRHTRGARSSEEGSDLFRRLLTAARLEQERRLGALRDSGFGARSDDQAAAATSRGQDRQEETEAQLQSILAKMLDGLDWHDITEAEAGGDGNETNALGVGGESAEMKELQSQVAALQRVVDSLHERV